MKQQKATTASALRPTLLGTTVLALLVASTGCAPADDARVGDVGPDTTTGTATGTTDSTATTGTGTGTTDEPTVVDGGVKLKGTPEYHSFVRLTHSQWANSVSDMLSLSEPVDDLVSTLYPDPPGGKFSNNEKSLYVGPDLWPDYERAAGQIAERFLDDAAAVAALGGLSNSSAFIDQLGRRAFRRPLTPDEATAYQALWDQGATFFASGDDSADGARTVVEAMLQSPQFVYRIETSDPGSRLNGYELAAKISLLLLNTAPSEELLAKAEAGELDTDEGLSTVVSEILDGPDATATLTRFHTELYGIDRYKNIEKSELAYPEYHEKGGEQVNASLEAADTMFFETIYSRDQGFRDILNSPVAFINRDIASFYGLESDSPELSEVELDSSRPGFLTRVGFLAYNGTLAHPDPIHRGVDINLKMLCKELSPPSGVIPPLPPPVDGQSNRERVAAHTGDAVCASCHEKIINPLGFAFENFDTLGQERTMDAGKPVDTASTYAFTDGELSFGGATDLIEILVEHPQAHSCYSANLAEYLLGRDVAGREANLVGGIFDSSHDSAASIKQLVLTTIVDPMFTNAQTGAAQ